MSIVFVVKKTTGGGGGNEPLSVFDNSYWLPDSGSWNEEGQYWDYNGGSELTSLYPAYPWFDGYYPTEITVTGTPVEEGSFTLLDAEGNTIASGSMDTGSATSSITYVDGAVIGNLLVSLSSTVTGITFTGGTFVSGETSFSPVLNSWNDVTDPEFWEPMNQTINRGVWSCYWTGSAWQTKSLSQIDVNSRTIDLKVRDGSDWANGARPSQIRVTFTADGTPNDNMVLVDTNNSEISFTSWTLTSPITGNISFTSYDIERLTTGTVGSGGNITVTKIELYFSSGE